MGNVVKVLGLFGSPRRGGNTDLLLEEALKVSHLLGEEGKGMEEEEFISTVSKGALQEEAAPAAEQARQMTAELFKLFEAWIRADPAQWICFSRRWPQEAYAD